MEPEIWIPPVKPHWCFPTKIHLQLGVQEAAAVGKSSFSSAVDKIQKSSQQVLFGTALNGPFLRCPATTRANLVQSYWGLFSSANDHGRVDAFCAVVEFGTCVVG